METGDAVTNVNSEVAVFRDLICRWLHRQGWPYNRDGKSYQRCLGRKLRLGCGRELLSKVQLRGRAPFKPHTELEIAGIEKWAREHNELAELERLGKP
mgnify:CR=1 FL=1